MLEQRDLGCSLVASVSAIYSILGDPDFLSPDDSHLTSKHLRCIDQRDPYAAGGYNTLANGIRHSSTVLHVRGE